MQLQLGVVQVEVAVNDIIPCIKTIYIYEAQVEVAVNEQNTIDYI